MTKLELERQSTTPESAEAARRARYERRHKIPWRIPTHQSVGMDCISTLYSARIRSAEFAVNASAPTRSHPTRYDSCLTPGRVETHAQPPKPQHIRRCRMYNEPL